MVDSLTDELADIDHVDTSRTRDYFTEKPSFDSGGVESIWISGMRIIAWISFVAVIIGGIVLGVEIGGGMGFITFIAALIIGFISVAGTMIFLDMALDISEIKRTLKNKE